MLFICFPLYQGWSLCPIEETIKVLYLFMERNRYGVLLCSATKLSLLKYFYDVREVIVGLL